MGESRHMKKFNGSILDFGCALGDAIPVYKQSYPNATLSGYDISESAIKYCRKKYSRIATFHTGEISNLPFHDVVIASHVMEHLSDDKIIIKSIFKRCKELFVFVPYRESPLYTEHINYYEENYYDSISPRRVEIFEVSYILNNSFSTILRDALKLKLSFITTFSKEIIMYHFSNGN